MNLDITIFRNTLAFQLYQLYNFKHYQELKIEDSENSVLQLSFLLLLKQNIN